MDLDLLPVLPGAEERAVLEAAAATSAAAVDAAAGCAAREAAATLHAEGVARREAEALGARAQLEAAARDGVDLALVAAVVPLCEKPPG